MLKTSVRPFERACLRVRRPARKLCVCAFLAPDYPHVVMPPDICDSSAYVSIRPSAYVSIRTRQHASPDDPDVVWRRIFVLVFQAASVRCAAAHVHHPSLFDT
jgi:hypothetical protein